MHFLHHLLSADDTCDLLLANPGFSTTDNQHNNAGILPAKPACQQIAASFALPVNTQRDVILCREFPLAGSLPKSRAEQYRKMMGNRCAFCHAGSVRLDLREYPDEAGKWHLQSS